jgi:hypothetical protein
MSAMRLLSLAVIACLLAARARGAPPLQFNRDIRPILAENCFTCHGGDKHKGGLRLDVRDSAIKPGKSTIAAIVPGKPDDSQLIQRITSSDPDLHMPPAESEHELTVPQITALRQWIAQDAPYEGHWAFRPPVRPPIPKTPGDDWCRNSIDAFAFQAMTAHGLKPSPQADKSTLLRRLHLDLTGLPPTLAEQDSFLADTNADAYEKRVDALLASPHYGEKWAMPWLDAARYADSSGYQRDKFRSIWPYRDYVIQSFNRDLPYDAFVTEQIAGDELPSPTQDQIVATGFLRNSMMNDEGGVDPEEFRLAAMFDGVEAIGTGILGLTVQCAQCHSHKYDPMTHEEYFKLFAFLNDADDIQPTVYSPGDLKKIGELTAQIQHIENQLREKTPTWNQQLQDWENVIARAQPHWIVLPLQYAGDEAEHWYVEKEDHSFLATPSAPRGTASFTWTTQLPRLTAFRLELLSDPTLPTGGPGCAPNGGCSLTKFSIDVAPTGDAAHSQPAKISAVTADREPMNPALLLDSDSKTAWTSTLGPGQNPKDRTLLFKLENPITAAVAPFPAPSGSIIMFHLHQDHSGPAGDDSTNQNLGRFRISATTDADPSIQNPLPRRISDLLAISPAKRTRKQSAEIFSYWRANVPEWKAANDQIALLLNQWPHGTTTLAQAPVARPRETRLFTRGDLRQPSRAVTAGVPQFLNPLPADFEPNRLTLAHWLTDRNSPTTARAFVNRLWQGYFGAGIVATTEDLGTQSEGPTNQNLLDYLACDFMDNGWKIKRMHRLIVMSSTYRQSSRVTPEGLASDPYNRWLARGPRFRVDAEIIRDIALSTSGLLNPTIGGRSVTPPAPAFLFQPPSSFAPFPWTDEPGDMRYRRGLYTLHRRSTPHPGLQVFDLPTALTSCARRSRSNTPLQALTTLNEPLFFDCARSLALQILTHGGTSDAEQIQYAFRRTLGRAPTETESVELTSLFHRELDRFSQDQTSAKKMVDGAPNALRPSIAPARYAAYTVVSRVLLNLDETMTKE